MVDQNNATPVSARVGSKSGHLASGSGSGSKLTAAAPVQVMFVSASRLTVCQLGQAMNGSTWKLSWAPDLESARRLLRTEAFSVILADVDLPDGKWHALRPAVAECEEPALIIVTCGTNELNSWAEALNLGAYDVLALPLDKTEVMRVLVLAWHALQRKRPGRALRLHTERDQSVASAG